MTFQREIYRFVVRVKLGRLDLGTSRLQIVKITKCNYYDVISHVLIIFVNKNIILLANSLNNG